MKTTILIGAAAVAVAMTGCVILPAAIDAETALSEHKAAISRGDVTAAMEWLSEDVRYIAGPQCLPARPCEGKEAARKGFVEWAVAQRVQVAAAGIGPARPAVSRALDEQYGAIESGPGAFERARVPVEVSWPELGKLGIERVRGMDEVRMRGGKIASVVFVPDLADAQTAALYKTRAAAAQAKAE